MLSSRKNQSVITLYFILGFVKGQEKTNIIYKKVFFGGSYVVLPQKIMGCYCTLYRYRTYRRRVFRVLACICCRCGLRGCVYLFVYEYVKKGDAARTSLFCIQKRSQCTTCGFAFIVFARCRIATTSPEKSRLFSVLQPHCAPPAASLGVCKEEKTSFFSSGKARFHPAD